MSAVENRQPGDPSYLERLGLRFYIDSNIIGDTSPAVAELQRLDREGWINLWLTDTVGTELADTSDDDLRRDLQVRAAQHVESMGPGYYGHSTYDHCVYAGDEDDERHKTVYTILFPGSDRTGTQSQRSRRKFRDAMHVATAIRYGCNGFITRDKHDFVRKSDEIAAAFNGFRIMLPETALAFVQRMHARYDARNP